MGKRFLEHPSFALLVGYRVHPAQFSDDAVRRRIHPPHQSRKGQVDADRSPAHSHNPGHEEGQVPLRLRILPWIRATKKSFTPSSRWPSRSAWKASPRELINTWSILREQTGSVFK